MMPAWGLAITLRPSPLPTIPLTAAVSSDQKSVREAVATRLLSPCWLPPDAVLPAAEAAPDDCTAEPEDTRNSLLPERCDWG
jgi:hypothetical protein